MILQKEYRKLEYIESTGTQYIDTGVIPKSTTRMVLDLQLSKDEGNRNGWGSVNSKEAFFCGTVSNNSNFVASVSKSWAYTFLKAKDTNRHIFDISNNAIKMDGETFGTGNIENTAESRQTLYLFALHTEYSSDGVRYYQSAKEKIYSCELYEGNNLVRNFIPCMRKSDNEVGLYDTVGEQFYTNQGTGKFNYKIKMDELLNNINEFLRINL